MYLFLFVQVVEEMQREREDELLSRADSLATQLASLHYQKAERRTRVLETSRAVLALQGLLMEELRERKSLKRQDMAHIIQSHCLVGGDSLVSPVSCFVFLLMTLNTTSPLTPTTGPRRGRRADREGENRVGRPFEVSV